MALPLQVVRVRLANIRRDIPTLRYQINWPETSTAHGLAAAFATSRHGWHSSESLGCMKRYASVGLCECPSWVARHFAGLPMTSGLLPEADIITAGRHVSNASNIRRLMRHSVFDASQNESRNRASGSYHTRGSSTKGWSHGETNRRVSRAGCHRCHPVRHPSRKDQEIALLARDGDRRRDTVLKRPAFIRLGGRELKDH